MVMPPPRLDAAALARVKAALAKMTTGPWAFENVDEQANDYNIGVALNEKDEPVAGEIHATDALYIDEAVAVELSRANAQAIVALVNAAPALVAGCETLAKIQALRTDWIHDRIGTTTFANDVLAALDAAREEPPRA